MIAARFGVLAVMTRQLSLLRDARSSESYAPCMPPNVFSASDRRQEVMCRMLEAHLANLMSECVRNADRARLTDSQ